MISLEAFIDGALPRRSLVNDDAMPIPTAMTREEQLVIAGVSLGSLAAACVVGFATNKLPKGLAPASYAGFASLLTVGSFYAARFGNRIIAAFALTIQGLFTFALVKKLGIFWMAPHYLAAMWMVIQMNRITSMRRTAEAKRKGPRPARASKRSADDPADLDHPGEPRAIAAPPSKRYTPPARRKQRTSTITKKR